MSEGKGSEIEFITALAALLRDSDLSEIEVKRDHGEEGEFRVRLTRAAQTPVAFPIATAAPAAAPPPGPAPAAAAPAMPEDPAQHPGAVASPMVGTVYMAPEPGASAFVRVGDSVEEGQTLLIIEAMKTMNQIPAPRAGIVRRVFVEDKQPVEFGAPLMIIE